MRRVGKGGISILMVMAFLATSSPAYASLPKDGSSPNACSSPQTVRTASILRLGVVIGVAQLRFSDPCDTVWGRVCFTPGSANYELHYTEGHRTVPSSNQYLWQGAAYSSSGTGVCSGYSYTVSGWTVGVEDDCMEDYGYTCSAHTIGALRDATTSYWSMETSPF